MNFLEHVKDENTLDLKLKMDFEIYELLAFLSEYKNITNINLSYSMVSFNETRNNTTYVKILTFFKAINDKKLDYLENINLSNNNLGNTYLNPPSDYDEYNLLMRWTWVPVTKAYTGFLNTWRYYSNPTENPAYDIKPPCSLIEYFSDALIKSVMPRLTTLNLSHTEFTDYDLENLCNAFKKGAAFNLEFFDLSCNKITCLGIEYLAMAINNRDKLSQLIEINLNNNYIATKGAIMLLQAIQQVYESKLDTLKLESNSIEDSATPLIISIIDNLPNIKVMKLGDNLFSATSFDTISRALSFKDIDLNMSIYSPDISLLTARHSLVIDTRGDPRRYSIESTGTIIISEIPYENDKYEDSSDNTNVDDTSTLLAEDMGTSDIL